MPHDLVLADRLAGALAGEPDVEAKRMFGGIAWLCRGHMACGVTGSRLVLRLGDEGAAAALRRPGVTPMDFTGRPMRSMVFVDESAVATARQLRTWIDRALAFARSLPEAASAKPRRRRRAGPG